MAKKMIATAERIVESDPPMRNYRPPSMALRKVVVIQVKRRLQSDPKSFEDSEVCGEDEIFDAGRSVEQVLGTKVVDLKDGRMVFWFIKRTAGKNLGFEFSFLQGAAAAIVLLELSDRETIQVTKELLRDICKVFSIPVMLVMGGSIEKDLIGLDASILEEIASKIVSFPHNRRRMTVEAS